MVGKPHISKNDDIKTDSIGFDQGSCFLTITVVEVFCKPEENSPLNQGFSVVMESHITSKQDIELGSSVYLFHLKLYPGATLLVGFLSSSLRKVY